jgi:PAS domain S-box-containing protein
MIRKETYEELEVRIRELECSKYELEKARRTLRETENRYERLVEGLGDEFMIYSHGLDGIITYVSPGSKAIFGFSKEEMVGSEWTGIINWDRRAIETARSNIRNMVSRIEYRRMEMSFRGSDGIERTVFISPHPIIGTDRSIVGVEGIVEDITDRKRDEENQKKLIVELQRALSEVNTLRGILPLCSFCKKIRDDKGYWEQVDVYIRKHSQADISHGICPACVRENYPDLDVYKD